MENISNNKKYKNVILVTGGASGIGLEISKFFINQSNDNFVFISDISSLKEDKEFKNSNYCFIKCDVTDENQVVNLLQTIEKSDLKLDTVVNSAGVAYAEVIATNEKLHDSKMFMKVFEINTFGTFLISKYSAKLMIKNKTEGNIIMISSLAGIEGQKGQTAYSSSKGAIIGMTLPMARDLGRYKIRVNTIAPGLINTPMISNMLESKPIKSLINQTPLNKAGSPIDIALTVEYLMKNEFVNGTVIRVDGGVRMHYF